MDLAYRQDEAGLAKLYKGCLSCASGVRASLSVSCDARFGLGPSQGVLSHFFSSVEGPSPKGANFLVTGMGSPIAFFKMMLRLDLPQGSVPLGGGLSSSAALVVASTLAFLAVNDKLASITQGQLVELCMENETRVGVNSGGLADSQVVPRGMVNDV